MIHEPVIVKAAYAIGGGWCGWQRTLATEVAADRPWIQALTLDHELIRVLKLASNKTRSQYSVWVRDSLPRSR